MISLLIIFSLAFIPNFIHTSIPFIQNPLCNLHQCTSFGDPGLYYASNSIGTDNVHIIYSSVGQLTISIFQTKKDYGPIFQYDALFARNYTNAIQFKDDIKPENPFTFVLRRLIEFNDVNDNGRMDDNENDTISHYLNDIQISNVTFRNGTTDQPTFILPIDAINGSLQIDIVYPGASTRDTKFPKLQTGSKSYFLNIALQANNYTHPKTRFAFEFYLISPNETGQTGSRIFSSRYIDDQYTPGIFNVWQMRPHSDLYPSSMLWKPVVYLSEDRTIESNTLMKIYSIQNNISLIDNVDEGIYYSFLHQPYVSGFKVSLGQAKDGFFAKTNYTFIQFTAGLDLLEPDATKNFVTVALIVSLALPAIVGVLAIIFMIKRRFSQQPASSYGAIDD